jgi:hypothetical protein
MNDEPSFMEHTRVSVIRSGTIEAIRLIHLPTGLTTEAPTTEEAVDKLNRLLIEEPFGPLSPILPVPVPVGEGNAGMPEPRQWKYRIC